MSCINTTSMLVLPLIATTDVRYPTYENSNSLTELGIVSSYRPFSSLTVPAADPTALMVTPGKDDPSESEILPFTFTSEYTASMSEVNEKKNNKDNPIGMSKDL